MGWFLRKTKKTRRPVISRVSESGWTASSALAMLRLGGWVMLILFVAGGWAIGQPLLRQHLALKQQGQTPAVALLGMPNWMPPQVMEEIQSLVKRTIDGSPFDRLTLEEATHELRANAWVKSVDRIVRRPGGVVEVRAAYRVPAALVQSNAKYCLVDSEAVRLPLEYDDSLLATVKLPVIRGVKAAQPAAGQAWSGGDVQAGLKLAAVIVTQTWIDQVKAIDVTNFGGRIDRGRPHLALQTRRGQVRWGRPPGDEHFYEPAASAKLQSIQQIMRKFKTIDANGRTVDVHGDTVLIASETATAAAR